MPEIVPAKMHMRSNTASFYAFWLVTGITDSGRLKHLCAALGDPLADKFTPEMFATYRRKRMDEGISQNNLNREHSYL